MTFTHNRETTLAQMRGVARYMNDENQTCGIAQEYPFTYHPYFQEVDGVEKFSPIGMVLFWVGAAPGPIDVTSERHMNLCRDPECFICSDEGGNADTSVYTKWVQAYIKDQADVTFTDEALDLLWDAELSGLTLKEWLAAGNPFPKDEVPF